MQNHQWMVLAAFGCAASVGVCGAQKNHGTEVHVHLTGGFNGGEKKLTLNVPDGLWQKQSRRSNLVRYLQSEGGFKTEEGTLQIPVTVLRLSGVGRIDPTTGMPGAVVLDPSKKNDIYIHGRTPAVGHFSWILGGLIDESDEQTKQELKAVRSAYNEYFDIQ